MLRAPDRDDVDHAHATAVARGWTVRSTPDERPYAPGYYSCVLADPDGIAVEIVHALDALPPRRGGEVVEVPGVDGITLGGYLFRTPAEGAERDAVIVLRGYGADARWHVPEGRSLAKAGLTALCLSQRGWLGSTGDEDQGFRQPDDIVAVASWLRERTGAGWIGLLGHSQGAQTALLAAARPAQAFAAMVSCFAPTDLAAWAAQTRVPGIAEYLADFVPPERMAACSPVTIAGAITCPTLILHGSEDANVPVAQAQAMAAVNPRLSLQMVDGARHGEPREAWTAVWLKVVAFLIRHL